MVMDMESLVKNGINQVPKIQTSQCSLIANLVKQDPVLRFGTVWTHRRQKNQKIEDLGPQAFGAIFSSKHGRRPLNPKPSSPTPHRSTRRRRVERGLIGLATC